MEVTVWKNKTGNTITQMAGKIWVLVGKALSCNLWYEIWLENMQIKHANEILLLVIEKIFNFTLNIYII